MCVVLRLIVAVAAETSARNEISLAERISAFWLNLICGLITGQPKLLLPRWYVQIDFPFFLPQYPFLLHRANPFYLLPAVVLRLLLAVCSFKLHFHALILAVSSSFRHLALILVYLSDIEDILF